MATPMKNTHGPVSYPRKIDRRMRTIPVMCMLAPSWFCLKTDKQVICFHQDR
nr:MAG TPA: hypothetical protein [Caudoviricetes sp.]